MIAIRTENLTKRYKDMTAVDCINLSIEQGELYSLLGVNGAGKTTTIKMLCGITKPTSGDAFVLGNSIIHDMSAIKEIIAISPQETAVARNLSVKENLKLITGIYGYSKDKSAKKISDISDKFGLNPILNKRADKLSGGWQRKLSIALALIAEPKILFLDEPTLGLDVLARNELWDIIRELKGKITIILTTHYMEEAEALSDHIGIMKDGKLLVEDTVEGLKARTNTDKVEDAFVTIIKEAKDESIDIR